MGPPKGEGTEQGGRSKNFALEGQTRGGGGRRGKWLAGSKHGGLEERGKWFGTPSSNLPKKSPQNCFIQKREQFHPKAVSSQNGFIQISLLSLNPEQPCTFKNQTLNLNPKSVVHFGQFLLWPVLSCRPHPEPPPPDPPPPRTALRRTAQNFAHFSLYRHNFISVFPLLGGLLVEFWWCF